MPRQGWRGIDHGDGGEDEFVARAGVATLLKVGTFERRARMRRIVAEAEEGQELCEGGFLDEEVETNAWVWDYLVSTAAVVRWLHACPSGPLAHHGEAGTGATVALACGWASTVAHALASGPLTLEGLHGGLAGELPPARLLRYVEEMERFDLIEVRREDGDEPRYAATEWLREGVGPILAAARVERRRSAGNTAAPDALDMRTVLRMTLARAELPGSLDGTCRLEVEVEAALASMTARFENGRAVEVEPALGGPADATLFGSCTSWLDAIVDPEKSLLRGGGERELADAVTLSLSRALFGVDPSGEPPAPADRGAERRPQVASAGREAQLAFAVKRRAHVEGLREQIEAHGQQAVEATTDISVSHQIHLWEQDLDVLFEVLEEGVPEVESLAEEMLALWKAWDETLDPDEPYI